MLNELVDLNAASESQFLLQRTIDYYFLRFPDITQELNNLCVISTLVRQSEYRQHYLSYPPRLRYIRTFNTFSFDPFLNHLVEGQWSDYHCELSDEIRRKTRSKKAHTFVNGNIFSLRAVPNVRVLVMHNHQNHVQPSHLNALRDKGYTIMDPYYRWLLIDEISPTQIMTIPSALSDVFNN